MAALTAIEATDAVNADASFSTASPLCVSVAPVSES